MITLNIRIAVLFLIFSTTVAGAPAAPARFIENSRLLQAASAGDLAGVRRALANGADVNATSEVGDHALNLAADAGATIVCQALVNAGADINAMGSSDRNALMAAAERGRTDLVSMLLLHKARVTCLTSLGETPLLLAARAGCAACVVSLINAGSDIGAADKFGQTPLAAAIGAWPRGASLSAFAQLASRMNINLADRQGRTPLMLAAYNERPDLLTVLLAHAANLAARDPAGRSALLFAAQGTSGSSADSRETSAMLYAATIDRKLDGPCALSLAAASGNVGAIQGLMTEGLSVNTPSAANLDGLLIRATSGSDLAKADSPAGMTPIMVAAARGQLASILELIRDHANAGARDTRGRTAIMYAARGGHVECAKRLIAYGVDVDAADLDGLRALMHAAATVKDASAGPAIVQALLAAGADRTAHDARGRTAGQIARDAGNMAVADALEGGK
ncbi:MAG: ankyrin repeat domain-containing protein [Capsulimonadaceae bacterium]|nr:ankyrin repeat domain-containing protein [Capsulimonadaceae bacterium]